MVTVTLIVLLVNVLFSGKVSLISHSPTPFAGETVTSASAHTAFHSLSPKTLNEDSVVVASIDSVIGLIPFGTIIFWVITSFRGVTSSPMKRMAPTRELVDEFSETLIVNLVISPCVSCESTTAQWLSLPSVWQSLLTL